MPFPAGRKMMWIRRRTARPTRAKPRRIKDFAPTWEGWPPPAGQGRNRPLISPTFRLLARAQVAQSVEQWIENPRVGSSILSLGTISPTVRPSSPLSEKLAITKINHILDRFRCSPAFGEIG